MLNYVGAKSVSLLNVTPEAYWRIPQQYKCPDILLSRYHLSILTLTWRTPRPHVWKCEIQYMKITKCNYLVSTLQTFPRSRQFANLLSHLSVFVILKATSMQILIDGTLSLSFLSAVFLCCNNLICGKNLKKVLWEDHHQNRHWRQSRFCWILIWWLWLHESG